MTLSIPDTAETVVRASHVPGPPQGRWTYADYAALPDDGNRYEIIDGVLYMAPAPIPEHEEIIMLLAAQLVIAIAHTGRGRVFGSPDIDVGDKVLRPDAVVVLREHASVVAEKRLIGPPDLVVEVASPSTAAYDRDAVQGKRGAYARIGVPEYWIVDPEAQTIEALALAGDRYDSLGVFHGDDRVVSRVLPDLDLLARRCFPEG